MSYEAVGTCPSIERDLREYLDRWRQEGDGEPSRRDLAHALSLVVCHRLAEQYQATRDRFEAADAKQVHYLSMEFLIGRSLSTNLSNLGLWDEAASAIKVYGHDL